MSKIASIEIISSLVKHPNPEVNTLSIATVLGWEVVVKTECYNVGDRVVFIEPDSVVPEIPEFEFMRKCGFRVRTVKFKGYPSNGLCVPAKELSRFNLDNIYVGESVAELIGIKHYEKPIAIVPGEAKGKLPSIVKRTDEDNLRSTPRDYHLLVGKECVITMKMDGQSASFFTKEGQFGVCSRELEIKESDNSKFWILARKYDIERKMLALNKDFVIQGESAGPGIQGNSCGLETNQLFVFNGLENLKYWNHDQLFDFCKAVDIPTVPVLWRGIFNFTIKELQEMANDLKYPSGNLAEGIVIRPVIESFDSSGSRLSKKVVSDVFKIKKKE